ncbi:MAG: hypothetical protein K0R46_612 [Herbinix sp.]|jgi:polysaccharide deacetylase family sporulation protein PdaB|nr:hypothetical protein [Herbinix sp.]
MNHGEVMGNREKMDMNEKPDRSDNEEADLKRITNTALFVKIGIVVLSIIAIISLGIKILPQAITVTNINSIRELPIYCVDTKENKVAISFDVAWGDEDIKDILTILGKNDVKATFFMTGEWINQYPEDVKLIAKEGHDLGNHSEKHMQMTQLSKEECLAEIMKTHERIKKLTGIEMKLFRSPYGDYNNVLMSAAKECGYDTIQWDVDSMDWKDYGVDGILKKTLSNDKLGNGSIILLHSGTKYTAEALELVIVGLEDLGYRIVPVSELIYTGEYTVDKTGKQFAK